MKRIRITPALLMISGALTLGFVSCNKSSSGVDQTEVAAAESLNVAEVEDDNTQIMADQAEANGAISGLRSSQPVTDAVDLLTSCAVITRDTVSVPHVITIDFGSGCTNTNGITRKGKIIVTYTGPYRANGTVVHIVSQDYYVNANKVDIDRTVTNLGTNDNGNLNFHVVSSRTVTFPDGTTCSSTADKNREWIAGASTPTEFDDDVYKVTGTGTHISRRGISYDATTLTPLVRKVACHEFVSGELKIVRHGQTDRYGIIDFGTGDCDDSATVTLDNGRSFTIDLRH